MATAAPASNETRNAPRRLRDPYLWHKLHSFTGIFPIGVFLVQHLIANSYALRGPDAYDTVVKVFGYLPFVAVLEVLIIYLPILFHSIYGFFIAAYGQPNLGRYGYGRNWMYFLQRASGVIAFFYIGFHIYNTSWAKYVQQWHGSPHPEDAISYQVMSGQLADPWYFAAYALGIIATVFHFTNGLWNFCIRWGITISARSQRLNSYLCWGLFAVFALIGLATITHLHFDGLSGASTAAPAAAAMTH
ncbi:MAG: succinate dehydrogenase cytochrome b558 subunit [Armatimonadetes bacterium]|nr:succinate dehydrogenase cytochrome b558 subunit [Armatimonadota bacterium]